MPSYFTIVSDFSDGTKAEGVAKVTADPAAGPKTITLRLFRSSQPDPTIIQLTTDANGYDESGLLLPPGDPAALLTAECASGFSLALTERSDGETNTTQIPKSTLTMGTSFTVVRGGGSAHLQIGNPGTDSANVQVAQFGVTPISVTVHPKKVKQVDLTVTKAHVRVTSTNSVPIIVIAYIGDSVNKTIVLPD